MSNKSLRVVVLAAGKGTRMKSELPKVLHRVCGQTLVTRTLFAIAGLEPTKVVVVVGYGEALVRDEIENLKSHEDFAGIELECVTQGEQHGTGHAVRVALENGISAAERVLIVPGDVPLLKSSTFSPLFEVPAKDADICVLTAPAPDPTGFGRVVRAEDGSISKIVEHRDCSEAELKLDEINTSIYCAKLSALNELLPKLQPKNAQGEYYLTDIVELGLSASFSVTAAMTDVWNEVAGANNRAELSELEAVRRTEINNFWMTEGVTLEDPSATYIDEGVCLGRDCYVGRGSKLTGNTWLDDGARVGAYCELVDVRVAKGAEIKFSSHLEDASIGKGAAIGPFARIRPGSEIGDEAKIGNFVETKKAVFEAGAKASHLTYIGDALVGAEANIGAGTITCNYDGKNKHKTVIGKGAFIGSNSSLVAPVTIGDGAYVGAGSTLSKDVPDGALGISRAKQVNIENYAKRKK